MLVHITRCSFPQRLADYREQIALDGCTNLELLLAGKSPGSWSLPASAMSGHPVWFQITANSIPHAKTLLGEAQAKRSKSAEHIAGLIPTIEKVAGHLVAVGLVSGEPTRSTPVDSHFRQRIFAPVGKLSRLKVPVPAFGGAPLTELGPFAHTAARRTNRLIGGDDDYRRMLHIVSSAGNRVPSWAEVTVDNHQGDWMATANDTACSWIAEDQLAVQFGIPLLRELSDDRRVYREVQVQPDAARRGRKRADAMVMVDGAPLPVEFKLNHRTEPDLPGQLLQYSGPATLTKNTGNRQRRWRAEHPFVLVIDVHGIHLFKRGQAVPAPSPPLLARGDIDGARIGKLRRRLRAELGQVKREA